MSERYDDDIPSYCFEEVKLKEAQEEWQKITDRYEKHKEERNRKRAEIEQKKLQAQKAQAEKRKEELKQSRCANFRLFLMSLSLTLPLIMLDAPILLICITTFLVFLPLFIHSESFVYIFILLYNIVRPILYIWGIIVTAQGNQDFFAIAFYILTALQLIDIIKKLIGTIIIISMIIKGDDNS